MTRQIISLFFVCTLWACSAQPMADVDGGGDGDAAACVAPEPVTISWECVTNCGCGGGPWTFMNRLIVFDDHLLFFNSMYPQTRLDMLRNGSDGVMSFEIPAEDEFPFSLAPDASSGCGIYLNSQVGGCTPGVSEWCYSSE